MNESVERDDELDGVLEAWAAPRVPAGFAERVVERALSDHSRSARPGGRGGIVVPLLLVAMFMSWGAWAGLEASRAASTNDIAESPPTSVEPSELSFELVSGPAYAEPEIGPEQERAAAPAKPRPVSKADKDEDGQAAEPPRVVHFPRCECGTSAIVCTCSD